MDTATTSHSNSLWYNVFMWLLLFALLGGAGYYVYSNRPCAKPMYYRLGTFDTRFGIGKQAFLADAAHAADLWNQEAGHTVLAYSATGTMPVNLVFDTRQEQADTGSAISQQASELDTEKAQVQQMQNEYNQQRAKFLSDRAAGADAQTLNQEASVLNDLATQIQSQTDLLNQKIANYNSSANAYNAQAGTNFEEGEFVEQSGEKYINLYEFKSTMQLERLMAHEFGHSLGLDHNTNPNSIMYSENSAQTLSLSTDDTTELQTRCALTWQNLLSSL